MDFDADETSSAASDESSISLPMVQSFSAGSRSHSIRRSRAPSQEQLSPERRLQLEQEISHHVRIAEMQEEIELYRRKSAYSEKENSTMKAQLDQALFKKAAAEAELREFEKMIRQRDAQLRVQVEKLEKQVVQGEVAQASLEKLLKQHQDLEGKLRNEALLKISTETTSREKDRQIAELQVQVNSLVQERLRMAPTFTRVQVPKKPHLTRAASVSPSQASAKPLGPRARASSLRSPIETQSDTGLYKSPTRTGTSTAAASVRRGSPHIPKPVSPPALAQSADMTSKDRRLFATRYINKTGTGVAKPEQLQAPPERPLRTSQDSPAYASAEESIAGVDLSSSAD